MHCIKQRKLTSSDVEDITYEVYHLKLNQVIFLNVETMYQYVSNNQDIKKTRNAWLQRRCAALRAPTTTQG